MDTSFLFEQRTASRFLCGINLVLGSVAGVYGVLNFGYGYPVTASVQLATAGINGVALALGMKACRTGGTSSGLPRQLTLISTLILTVILILGGGGLSLASPFLFVLPPALLLLARRPVAVALNVVLVAILAASVARPGLTAWVSGDDRVYNVSVLVAYVAVNIYSYMIAELRFRAYRRVRYLATHDPVTGLNRFDAREACLVESSWAVLVQLRDTDHIRLEGGNRLVEHVMRVTAQRLSERWSRACGLFSYSETSILATPDIDSSGGWSAWINTTMQDLSRPVTGEERSVTPHLAVFVVPDAETLTRSELGARLEAVIQSSRGDNSRITFYDPEIGEQIRRRIEMYDLLRSARERGELYLVYQPLVDAIDGEIVGAEVLMRWESPELGSVSPGVFIPVAEETGLISELTEWMVALAWREARSTFLRRTSSSPTLSNASTESSPGRVSTPPSSASRSPRACCCGNRSLRESISAQSVLDTLVSLGFSLSIDDFGTGYSNLSYLRSLSVHRIKIDKSFVDDIVLPTGEVNSRATPLVEAMVFMAKTLGIGTLAEGVETAEQAAVLRDLGCETFQGYLFGKPLPLDLPSDGDGEAVGR